MYAFEFPWLCEILLQMFSPINKTAAVLSMSYAALVFLPESSTCEEDSACCPLGVLFFFLVL